MAKFRKKPIVIEAEQFRAGTVQGAWPAGVDRDESSPTGYGIFTLEHTARKHEVTDGDWIVTGVQGERYACKPDIFESTYEAVHALPELR